MEDPSSEEAKVAAAIELQRYARGYIVRLANRSILCNPSALCKFGTHRNSRVGMISFLDLY